MLNYKKDRLDYGRQLNPPEGFTLERAVATTYSLDLEALLSIPVALFYNKNLDGEVSEDRIDIFDAIQKTSDIITIYCQKGMIKVPSTINRMISFVEESVNELLPTQRHTSFHPKIWVLRYSNSANEILYRVMVLSRNMTFDRSWDLAVIIEGMVRKTVNHKARPLADFIRYLVSLKGFPQHKQFIKDLEHVQFETVAPFQDWRFHPTGIHQYANPLTNIKWQDLLILSPFLDNEALLKIAGNAAGKKVLLSRKEELDKIPINTLNKFNQKYCFSQFIVDGEDYEQVQEEANDIRMKQNIHAKLFIGNTPEGATKWFIGSANCSIAALTRNQEFLVEFLGDDERVPMKTALDLLLGKEHDVEIFQMYERKNKQAIENLEYDFRPVMHRLLNYLSDPKNYHAVCMPNNEDRSVYNMAIRFQPHFIFNHSDLKQYVAPYGWKGDLKTIQTEEDLVFENIAIHHLSPFIVFKLVHPAKNHCKEFVTKIIVDLPSHRKKTIFSSIIHSNDKFLQFIGFLLGSNTDQVLFKDVESHKKGLNHIGKNWFNTHAQLYEEMLMAASRNPGKLLEIQKLIKKLEDCEAHEIIPSEFYMVWNVFSQLIPDASE